MSSMERSGRHLERDKGSDCDGGGRLRPPSNAPTTARWTYRSWVGFDTETTGVDPLRDRLVTAAAVQLKDPLDDPPCFTARTWLADPGVEIPAGAAQIHGVTSEHARRHGHPATEVIAEVCQHLRDLSAAGTVLVVFNAGFDLPLLRAESGRHGSEYPGWDGSRETATAPPPAGLVVDPLVLDRALDRYRKGKRTLAHLAAEYQVPLPYDTHRADVDAELTLRVLRAMVLRYPELREMSDEELHDFQVTAHAQWAQSFTEYLRSRGRDATIPAAWF